MKKRMDKYDALKIDNQICFPLYAASRELIKHYRPFLEELDLTYTQYITLMVLWESGQISVKDLGKKLYLDSGTLTPVLKSLEAKGFVKRERSSTDERVVQVETTEAGMQLREAALQVPQHMSACVKLDPEDAVKLYQLLYQVLDGFRN